MCTDSFVAGKNSLFCTTYCAQLTCDSQLPTCKCSHAPTEVGQAPLPAMRRKTWYAFMPGADAQSMPELRPVQGEVDEDALAALYIPGVLLLHITLFL